MDLRKMKGLQIMKQDGIRKMHKGWAVRSQSAKKYYFVDDAFNCSCPDCQAGRATFCKHAHALRYYLGIEKPDGTKEKVRLTYKQAWHAYTEAQKSEVNQFDVLLKDLVQSIGEPDYVFGRPSLNKRELTFCAIQKVYSQLSSRRAYSLFKNAQAKELIKKTPNYNAINKFLNSKEITPILKELVGLSASPLKAVESKFAVDSTGFRTTRFYEYCKDKHHLNKVHRYVKLHALCGTKTNVICSAEVTQENGSDCKQFEGLVKELSGNGFKIEEISADKAYSSRANLQLIDELGGTPFIPFREGTGGKSKANPIWKKMYHYFCLNQGEFAKHYHLRSNVETSFHMIKSKFGDSLKSKTFTSQTNELLCKVIAFNIVALIHEMHELGVKVKF